LELSQLDLQVLERLRQGKTYKTIAHELNMSESTVELHIRHSLERIDARNRGELLLLLKRFHYVLMRQGAKGLGVGLVGRG